MNIRVFTLCDGAYNYNGKLTLVGTIDNIKAPKYPNNADVSLAIKMSFLPNENGEKEVIIRFQDSEGKLLVPEIQSPKTKIESKGEEGRLVMVVDLHGLPIPHEGDYKVILAINNETFELPFKAIR